MHRYFQLVNAWEVDYDLCASLYSIELKETVCFVNVYGPYMERERYWNNLLSMDCLICSKMILAGDLNYSLGFSEIWGDRARVDNLFDFFSMKMDGFGLVDIAPAILLPT